MLPAELPIQNAQQQDLDSLFPMLEGVSEVINLITSNSFALDPGVAVGAFQISYLYPTLRGGLSSSKVSIL